MGEENKHGCETCAVRLKAQERPRSLIGLLWKLHTYICPGWKAYQRSLNENRSIERD